MNKNESKPIFLWRIGSGFPKSVIKQLEESGYIVIGVKSFDDVKVMEPLAGKINADMVSRVAFDMISGYEQRERQFGKGLWTAIKEQMEATP